MNAQQPLRTLRGGLVAAAVGAATLTGATVACGQSPTSDWPQHSMDRPMAPVVTPGPAGPPVPPPSDAVVLFDGRDLSAWQAQREGGGPAGWKVENGYFEVVPGSGGIQTKQAFGDVQIHVEWMSPNPPRGESQDRGNSGVFFGGGRYEVQVLDSYQSRTYTDGQAGALYGQYPPLVNAVRRPGEWQTYDIVYRAPRFDAAGKVTRPARLTVFLNNVLVQDNSALVGPTSNRVRLPYEAHPERMPIALQDHSHPVRFRNIWLRELTEPPAPPASAPQR